MKRHTPPPPPHAQATGSQPPVITFYPDADPSDTATSELAAAAPRTYPRGSDNHIRPAGGSSLLGGRYDLRRRIGSGGMAVVYLGWDLLLEREVAVKLLREEFVRDARQVSRFRREAQLLARVDSDHVIQIYDMHFGRDACYLVLRHVIGRTLDRIVASNGALASATALQIACDVLEGLAHLHAEGLVHRDVKPSNVLVGNDERAVLLDLGVACDLRRPGITPVNFTAGTRAYMAPEQRRTGKVDERSDVYQTGLLLLFATTGIDAAQFAPEKGLGDALLSLPPKIADVIERAIASDPDKRFASAVEMRYAAAHAMREHGTLELQLGDPSVVEESKAEVKVQAARNDAPLDLYGQTLPIPIGGLEDVLIASEAAALGAAPVRHSVPPTPLADLPTLRDPKPIALPTQPPVEDQKSESRTPKLDAAALRPTPDAMPAIAREPAFAIPHLGPRLALPPPPPKQEVVLLTQKTTTQQVPVIAAKPRVSESSDGPTSTHVSGDRTLQVRPLPMPPLSRPSRAKSGALAAIAIGLGAAVMAIGLSARDGDDAAPGSHAASAAMAIPVEESVAAPPLAAAPALADRAALQPPQNSIASPPAVPATTREHIAAPDVTPPSASADRASTRVVVTRTPIAADSRGADQFYRVGKENERKGAVPSAITAYRQYLRMEPEGPFAPYARIRVAELESALHE